VLLLIYFSFECRGVPVHDVRAFGFTHSQKIYTVNKNYNLNDVVAARILKITTGFQK
jgi:hypothetical protein